MDGPLFLQGFPLSRFFDSYVALCLLFTPRRVRLSLFSLRVCATLSVARTALFVPHFSFFSRLVQDCGALLSNWHLSASPLLAIRRLFLVIEAEAKLNHSLISRFP